MCGIVGYIGTKDVVPVLLDGLYRLEYRGYDSAGIAVLRDGRIDCERAVGKIKALEDRMGERSWTGARTGIAHTRWATHGRPTENNAHPHADCTGAYSIVHNGIIENYRELKAELQSRGHRFLSETDTEVIAHLIEECDQGDFVAAVRRALSRLVGTYGLAAIKQGESCIVAARMGSPLLLGVGADGCFVSSDASALLRYTREVVYLEDGDLAVIGSGQYTVESLLQPGMWRDSQTLDWDVEAAEKQGFPHFMLKEIHEQPETVRNAMRGRILQAEGTAKLGGLMPVEDRLDRMNHLIILSCGTSYYAGLLGRYILESITNLAVEVELASEFRYRKLNLRKNTIVLAISQSGETADTLAAIREAKRKGITCLGLVNVVGSTIARETDAGIYSHAGPEIGVASTKALMAQLTTLYLLGLYFGRKQSVSVGEGQEYIAELEAIPDKIRTILERGDEIEKLAEKYSRYQNFLYMGRKYNYSIALEGALKLKEISYLHAEGYAAGEMKHGPIALIDENFPSIMIAPRDDSYEKMMSNIQEIKARSGPVLAVATEGDDHISELADDVFRVPKTHDHFYPLLTLVPLQLLAYHIARFRGCDIDKPRNLAKSVTVE
ncbi:MAG: glutamine--fructose-6-phosphate transaminase (isomerizing) [Acidobacteriota bacterium]